jgi:hypothetical protein
MSTAEMYFSPEEQHSKEERREHFELHALLTEAQKDTTKREALIKTLRALATKITGDNPELSARLFEAVQSLQAAYKQNKPAFQAEIEQNIRNIFNTCLERGYLALTEALIVEDDDFFNPANDREVVQLEKVTDPESIEEFEQSPEATGETVRHLSRRLIELIGKLNLHNQKDLIAQATLILEELEHSKIDDVAPEQLIDRVFELEMHLEEYIETNVTTIEDEDIIEMNEVPSEEVMHPDKTDIKIRPPQKINYVPYSNNSNEPSPLPDDSQWAPHEDIDRTRVNENYLHFVENGLAPEKSFQNEIAVNNKIRTDLREVIRQIPTEQKAQSAQFLDEVRAKIALLLLQNETSRAEEMVEKLPQLVKGHLANKEYSALKQALQEENNEEAILDLQIHAVPLISQGKHAEALTYMQQLREQTVGQEITEDMIVEELEVQQEVNPPTTPEAAKEDKRKQVQAELDSLIDNYLNSKAERGEKAMAQEKQVPTEAPAQAPQEVPPVVEPPAISEAAQAPQEQQVPTPPPAQEPKEAPKPQTSWFKKKSHGLRRALVAGIAGVATLFSLSGGKEKPAEKPRPAVTAAEQANSPVAQEEYQPPNNQETVSTETKLSESAAALTDGSKSSEDQERSPVMIDTDDEEEIKQAATPRRSQSNQYASRSAARITPRAKARGISTEKAAPSKLANHQEKTTGTEQAAKEVQPALTSESKVQIDPTYVHELNKQQFAPETGKIMNIEYDQYFRSIDPEKLPPKAESIRDQRQNQPNEMKVLRKFAEATNNGIFTNPQAGYTLRTEGEDQLIFSTEKGEYTVVPHTTTQIGYMSPKDVLRKMDQLKLNKVLTPLAEQYYQDLGEKAPAFRGTPEEQTEALKAQYIKRVSQLHTEIREKITEIRRNNPKFETTNEMKQLPLSEQSRVLNTILGEHRLQQQIDFQLKQINDVVPGFTLDEETSTLPLEDKLKKLQEMYQRLDQDLHNTGKKA